MIVVKPAGGVTPRVDKRAAESIICVVDCSELLEVNEVIISIEVPKSSSDIIFSDIRSRGGKLLEVRVDNSELSTSQYVDFNISLAFTTNFKNKKLAVFNLRVYK